MPELGRLEGVELRRLSLGLVAPWHTALGIETTRDVLLVRAVFAGAEGWGECVAMREPTYSSEYTDGALDVLRRHLLPRLLAGAPPATGLSPGAPPGTGLSPGAVPGTGLSAGAQPDPDPRSSVPVDAESLTACLAPVRGHPMAKAALEAAWLDAEGVASGMSLARRLGGTRRRVSAGVAVGVTGSVTAVVDEVSRRVAEGYHRVKLKIHPGWDLEPVAAVRAAFGSLALQVDANGSYRPSDAAHLARLDPFDLLLIEQPLAVDDLLGHAELGRRLVTPVCLDESITSVTTTAAALALGACRVVNLKPGRVGGLLESVRIHDLCATHGVPVWCGGMLETGVGRAANLALASLPNFSLPGDLSASGRWYREDIAEPVVLGGDGTIEVPDGPGAGAGVRRDRIDALTAWREWWPAP